VRKLKLDTFNYLNKAYT